MSVQSTSKDQNRSKSLQVKTAKLINVLWQRLQDVMDKENLQKAVTMFEKTMQFQDKISSCLKENKYFEACGYQTVQYRLGPNIHFASIVMELYVSLMETNQLNEAEELPRKLAELFRDKFANSTDEILEYTRKVLAKNQTIKAFLLFQVIWLFESEKVHDETTYQFVRRCNLGASQCVMNIYHQVQFESKKPIIDRIVTWIRMIKADIAKAKHEVSYLAQAQCLLGIGETFTAVGEFETALSLYKEGCAFLEQKFGKSVEKQFLYGAALFGIGVNYGQITPEKPRENIKALNKALSAMKKAQDPSCPEHSIVIESCQEMIETIRDKPRARTGKRPLKS